MQRCLPTVLLVSAFALLARPCGAGELRAQEIPNRQPSPDGIGISGKSTAEIEARLNDTAQRGFRLERIQPPSTKRGHAKLAEVTFLMMKSDVPTPYEYALISSKVASHREAEDRIWKLSHLRANGFIVFGAERFAIRWELGVLVGGRERILVFERRPGAGRNRDLDAEDRRDAGWGESRVICESDGKAFTEQVLQAAAEGFRAERRKPAPHQCPKEDWNHAQQPSILMARDPGAPAKVWDYRVLASRRASSLLKQIQYAAAEGYRVVPEAFYTGMRSWFRTSPLIVVLEKVPEGDDRFEYLLVSTAKAGQRRQEVRDAEQLGYRRLGSVMLGNRRRSVILFERPRNPE